jgi:putative ABC transport system permease protein
MLRNYFKIAFRHFWNHKTYVLTNVVGLAVAIAICILAYFHLAFNFQFNEMYDATTKNIYRIELFKNSKDKNEEFAVTNASLITSLAPETPEIKLAVRYEREWLELKIITRGQYFKSSFVHADSGFFLMFKHKFIYGNEKTALKDDASIVLNAASAKKYFGNKDPIGKTVTYFLWGRKRDVIVTGVIEQPANSMFTFDAMVRIDDQLRVFTPFTPGVETFVEIPNKKDVVVVQK